ncbi:MAG: hypothetical protein AB7G88_07550 [Thermomicrobiales bacterium]
MQQLLTRVDDAAIEILTVSIIVTTLLSGWHANVTKLIVATLRPAADITAHFLAGVGAA